MAKSGAGSGIADLEFGVKVEQARRRARKQPESLPGSRFDDFEDFSAEPATDSPVGKGGQRTPRRRQRGLRWPEATWVRWALGLGALVLLGGIVAGGMVVRRFFLHDPRFVIASSASVTVSGSTQVTGDQVLAVFGEDIGRNIFFVPLAERQAQLQALPWVSRATVERLLPNRLAIQITERVPVAFIQDHGNVSLVDADGVILDMPPSQTGKYSFPVLSGFADDASQTTRAARMAIFQDFVRQVDAGGANVSGRISELDLSDPEDVVATFDESGAAETLHFGNQDFAQRYRTYQSHLAEWRQEYPLLATVDLRNAPQVTLGMRKAADGASAPAAGDAAAATPAATPTPAPTVDSSTAPGAAAAAPPVATVPKATHVAAVVAPRAPSRTARTPVKAAAPKSATKPASRPTVQAQKHKTSPAIVVSDPALATFRAETPQSVAPATRPHLSLHMPSQTAGVQ